MASSVIARCARRTCFVVLASLLGANTAPSQEANEDGYDLWLRYRLVTNASRLAEYRGTFTSVDGLLVRFALHVATS